MADSQITVSSAAFKPGDRVVIFLPGGPVEHVVDSVDSATTLTIRDYTRLERLWFKIKFLARCVVDAVKGVFRG